MYRGSSSSPEMIHDRTERHLHEVAAAATIVTTETAVIGLSRGRPRWEEFNQLVTFQANPGKEL